MNARQKRQEKGIGLLEICLSLHMSNTGSSDPLDEDVYEFYLDNLLQTLYEWKEYKISQLFDNAVKALVKATLEENRAALGNRKIN